jgi:peptidoglycan glycosyltransferase
LHLTRTVNHLTISILILFGVITISAAYWAIVGPDTILKRTDNPRLVDAEAQIIRGRIVDRNGTVLVDSVQNPDGSTTRRYFYPEMNSALGYASLRYGLSGAEAAYNITLKGDDFPTDFGTALRNVLSHEPRRGSDIRLTFDRVIQYQVVQAMGTHQGAAVVLTVPGGEVLAMASLPTFNPNTLDADWEALTTAPGKPFFNRVLQGAYQPGGILQTLLLAGAILSNYPLDRRFERATQSVLVGDIPLECITFPNVQTLNLRQAYIFGCPYPFAKLTENLGPATIQSIFTTFGINQPVTLPGFIFDPGQLTSAREPLGVVSEDDFIENALGQGAITVNPMQMAVLAGTILNEGNAPNPHTLLEVRQSEASGWDQDNTSYPTIPVTTAEVARILQTAMRDTVREGVGKSAAQADMDIGGHAALAYSGEGTQSWFIGFVTLGNREGIAVAVVIEKGADPNLAASVGGQALATAYAQLQSP